VRGVDEPAAPASTRQFSLDGEERTLGHFSACELRR
jgi:hypothetical protein